MPCPTETDGSSGACMAGGGLGDPSFRMWAFGQRQLTVKETLDSFFFFFLLCIATRPFFSLTWRRLFVHGARSRELSAQGLLRKFCRPGEAGVSSQAAGVSVWKDEQRSGDLGLRRQLPDGRAVAFSLTL